MKNFKLLLTSVAVASLVAACGGGDDPKTVFSSVVTFGDSLSDAGTYRVGTIAQLGGGKFTVNSAADKNDKTWTEALAVSLGAPAQCAAQTGLLPNNGVTGAAVVNIAACAKGEWLGNSAAKVDPCRLGSGQCRHGADDASATGSSHR